MVNAVDERRARTVTIMKNFMATCIFDDHEGTSIEVNGGEKHGTGTGTDIILKKHLQFWEGYQCSTFNVQ